MSVNLMFIFSINFLVDKKFQLLLLLLLLSSHWKMLCGISHWLLFFVDKVVFCLVIFRTHSHLKNLNLSIYLLP